jgi:hypothetical protein
VSADAPSPAPAGRSLVAPLSLVFVLSGASALLFESVWFRLAGLALGNSVWATSLVLAGFMAGLGLGNLLALLRGAGCVGRCGRTPRSKWWSGSRASPWSSSCPT